MFEGEAANLENMGPEYDPKTGNLIVDKEAAEDAGLLDNEPDVDEEGDDVAEEPAKPKKIQIRIAKDSNPNSPSDAEEDGTETLYISLNEIVKLLANEYPSYLVERVAEAYENPASEEEYQRLNAENDEAEANFLAGGDHDESIRTNEAVLALPGAIEMSSPSEFVTVLNILMALGLDKSVIPAVYEHEMAHYKVDKSYGLSPKFRIVITNKADGLMLWHPMVYSHISGFDEQTARRMTKESLDAATDPSDSDRAKLRKS
jgi:hypothetical protein